MKKCPVKRCVAEIPDRTWVCTYHWRCLPAETREEWSCAAAAYVKDEVSLGELEEVRARMMEFLEGAPHFEPVRSVSDVCRRCGRQVVLSMVRPEDDPEVTLSVTLEEVRAGAKAKAEAEDAAVCVVGGVAVAASGMSPQYARFVRHQCQPGG